MRKTIKKAIAFALILSMIIPYISASAVDISESLVITPYYTYISSISPSLSVSGTTATYSLTVKGTSTVTSISAVLQIQKKQSDGTYSNYGTSWTASSAKSTLTTSGTKTVASGGTYRLKATVTVYTSSGSSTETVYS